MPSGITLLIGGARSGKSALAVKLGQSFDGPVTFAATATAADNEMARRISRHRDERPHRWVTLESPLLDHALPPAGLLIIDCITLWVANVLFAGHPDSAAEAAQAAEAADTAELFEADLARRVTALLSELRRRTGPCVVVSNEVGLGIVPDSPLGRIYRDALGRVNTSLAAGVDRSMFLAAGRIAPLLAISEVFR